MFCPNCEIEYRPGFTRCNDCDVELVEHLPGEEGAGGEGEGDGGEEALALLWSGEQGGVYNEIAAALDAAGLRYNRERLDARLTFGSGHAALEIWVAEAELEAARKVVDETLAQIAQAIPAGDEAGADADEGDGEEPPRAFENPDPEDASAEVWSGREEGLAQFLKSCLAANGIGCHLEGERGRETAVRVLPEHQGRAARIVRQVVEGIAPE